MEFRIQKRTDVPDHPLPKVGHKVTLQESKSLFEKEQNDYEYGQIIEQCLLRHTVQYGDEIGQESRRGTRQDYLLVGHDFIGQGDHHRQRDPVEKGGNRHTEYSGRKKRPIRPYETEQFEIISHIDLGVRNRRRIIFRDIPVNRRKYINIFHPVCRGIKADSQNMRVWRIGFEYFSLLAVDSIHGLSLFPAAKSICQ